MTFILVAIGGFLTGALIRAAVYSSYRNHITRQMEELASHQLTERDLIDWSRHTSGGRRG